MATLASYYTSSVGLTELSPSYGAEPVEIKITGCSCFGASPGKNCDFSADATLRVVGGRWLHFVRCVQLHHMSRLPNSTMVAIL